MEISRKNNWTKEEESTLINEIESAGEILRGSGNCADINKKKRQLWKDIAARINSVHGNHRAVDDIRKKWNNMKLTAKTKVDASFREANKTGGAQTPLEWLILAADKGITNSDRIRDMFETTPAFCGISGAIDNFVIPAPENTQSIDSVVDTSILDAPEIELPTTYRPGKKCRKRRRVLADDDGQAKIQDPLRAAELIPLQQEVLHQQLAVFSAQLQLIEDQRDCYRLKRQRLVENS